MTFYLGLYLKFKVFVISYGFNSEIYVSQKDPKRTPRDMFSKEPYGCGGNANNSPLSWRFSNGCLQPNIQGTKLISIPYNFPQEKVLL